MQLKKHIISPEPQSSFDILYLYAFLYFCFNSLHPNLFCRIENAYSSFVPCACILFKLFCKRVPVSLSAPENPTRCSFTAEPYLWTVSYEAPAIPARKKSSSCAIIAEIGIDMKPLVLMAIAVIGVYLGFKREFAYYFIDECQSLGEIPDRIRSYIDYEAYGRDLDLEGRFVVTNHGVFECPY